MRPDAELAEPQPRAIVRLAARAVPSATLASPQPSATATPFVLRRVLSTRAVSRGGLAPSSVGAS
jgi:hypothetical protein